MTDQGSDFSEIGPEEAAYFRTIEQRFGALRGAPMLLSPRDWTLIADWWSSGVPLGVVLEAMEEIFAARVRRGEIGNRVNSLAYIRPEVTRRLSLQREMAFHRRGEGEETSRLVQQLRRHLTRLAKSLKEAAESARGRKQEGLARTLLMAAGEIRTLRQKVQETSWDVAETEQKMESLNLEVSKAAWCVFTPETAKQLADDSVATLDSHRSDMSDAVFAATREAVMDRLGRLRLGIPRISLLSDG